MSERNERVTLFSLDMVEINKCLIVSAQHLMLSVVKSVYGTYGLVLTRGSYEARGLPLEVSIVIKLGVSFRDKAL